MTDDARRGAEAARRERGPYASDPLFAAVVRDGLVTSSSLDEVRAAIGAPRVDGDALVELLTLEPPDDPTATVFDGVRVVPPGHVATLDRGRMLVAPSASLDASWEPPARTPSVAEAAEELRARLTRAIARALGGGERAAVLVGGVDSSAILACAARIRGASRKELVALTVDAGGPTPDAPHVDALCNDLGLVPVHLACDVGGARLRDALVVDAEPHLTADGGMQLAMYEAARARGATVVLGGAGGDDLLEGEPALAARARLREHGIVAAAAWTATLAGPPESRPLARLRDLLVRPVLAPWWPARVRRARLARLLRRSFPWAGPRLRARLDAIARRPWEPHLPEDARARRLALATSPRFDRVARGRARLARAAGVRAVDVFFDPEVADFAATLSPELLLAGGRTRGLLREAMRGLLPDGVRLRMDKASFEHLLGAQVEAAGGFAALAELADTRALHAAGIVDAARVRRAFAELEARALDTDLWVLLWPVLAAEAFLRRYGPA